MRAIEHKFYKKEEGEKSRKILQRLQEKNILAEDVGVFYQNGCLIIGQISSTLKSNQLLFDYQIKVDLKKDLGNIVAISGGASYIDNEMIIYYNFISIILVVLAVLGCYRSEEEMVIQIEKNMEKWKKIYKAPGYYKYTIKLISILGLVFSV